MCCLDHYSWLPATPCHDAPTTLTKEGEQEEGRVRGLTRADRPPPSPFDIHKTTRQHYDHHDKGSGHVDRQMGGKGVVMR